MVFGNMGDDCATGVAFTRDPATGENRFYGEYLINAQGEDVVAGIRTPQLNNLGREKLPSGNPVKDLPTLEEAMPKAYRDISEVFAKLEAHYRDMQDIEFTIEKGKLWMLQTRNGKRTGFAAVRIAVDMVDEGLISRKEAVARIDPEQLDQLLHPIFDPKAAEKKPPPLLAKGLPAGPGRGHRARSSSPPRTPRRGRAGREGDPGAASRPAPRTSAACRSPRGSSPPAAA